MHLRKKNQQLRFFKEVLNMASIELHKVDVQEFLSVVDTCEGDVFLVTDEGDRLNLKSKL